MATLLEVLQAAGFKGSALKTAWAVAMRESGGNAGAYNPDRSTGDDSHGLFQINMLGSMGHDRDAKFRQYVKGYTGIESLKDPVVNARAAFYMTNKGTNWYHWDIDSTGYDGGSHAAAYQAQLAKFNSQSGTQQVKGSTRSLTDKGGPTPTDPLTVTDAPAGQDTMNVADLSAMNGFTEDFVKSHPAVRKVFEQAINEDWVHQGTLGQAKFDNALRGTKWWQSNSSYARQYLIAKMKGGKDWEDQYAQAQSEVQATAVKMGAELDDASLKAFTDAYLANGWKDRPQFLASALTGNGGEDFATDHLNYKKGGPQAIMFQLQEIARKNGVKFSDDYYSGAARSVLAGLSDINDYVYEIRAHGASKLPIFKDRIMNGENAADVASPYMTRMSDKLGIPLSQITLDDPMILKALGGVDEKGNPKAMSLWDFDKALKQHDLWQYTKEASDEVGSLASSIIGMFGMGG